MTNSMQVNYYLKIALDINKKVGGTRAYEIESSNRDRFLVIRDNVNKNFYYVKAKLEEREKKRGDPHQINIDVRQKITEIYSQLNRMRDAVAAEKGASIEAQKVKNDMIDKLQVQAKQLQHLIDDSDELQRKIFNKGKNVTLTQMKQQLLEGPKTGRFNSGKAGNSQGATEIELQKIQDWKKKDQQIEAGLDQIISGIKTWKEGLKSTRLLIEQSDRKILELSTKVDTVNQNLFNSNKQLKGIIQKFRKPHKFCLDIVLVLILIALIVGIIKLSGG